MTHRIVSISVVRFTESCKRTTYYVRLTTDEGFTTEPVSHRTGHEYVEDGQRVVVPGQSAAEALVAAFSSADHWSDLLGIPVDPYEEDGVVVEPPTPVVRRFEMQRKIAARRTSRTG